MTSFIQNMKTFADTQDKFLISNWLRSLDEGDLEYLVCKSANQDEEKARDLIMTLALEAIVLESACGVEVKIELEKVRDVFNVMPIFIGLELASRHDSNISFKPFSVFSDDVEVCRMGN